MINQFPSEKLIASYAPVAPVWGSPFLKAHQTEDMFGLWQAWEKESGQEQEIPFWAVVWPGALVLAKYILHNSAIVRGRRVLDLGCGCGIAGIAAAKAGAHAVLANDIDPVALYIAELNARANKTVIQTDDRNLLESNKHECACDVIFIADLFYTSPLSDALSTFIQKYKQLKTEIILADAGRNFAPNGKLSQVYEKTIPVNKDLEGRNERNVKILMV